MVRMAHLAVVASHTVNGVAEIHSQLLKTRLFPMFDELYPKKFTNMTNGITPRRWLLACNRDLSALISSKIGNGWAKNLDELKKLEKFADDKAFQKAYMNVKYANESAGSRWIQRLYSTCRLNDCTSTSVNT